MKKATIYKDLRREVFERDGNECVLCGHKNNIVCHHLTYENYGYEPASDMMTLCRSCHMGWHKENPEIVKPKWGVIRCSKGIITRATTIRKNVRRALENWGRR